MSVPRPFIDRQDERDQVLGEVETARAAGEQGVFVFQGIGGVGKTALMLWCVQQLVSSFDVVLDVSMGASAEAKTVEEILDLFLLKLGAPMVPPTRDGKQVVYRAETARRNVLVVIDDVDTAESLEELLPASTGSVVLATSRQRLEAFELAGFTGITVDVLGKGFGVELLTHKLDSAVVAEASDDLEAIAELCGNLPLALAIVRAQLRSRRHGGPAELLGRLRSAKSLLAEFVVDEKLELQFVYETSYTKLGERERKLYRRLGLHPGSRFPEWAAAALLDEDERGDAPGTLWSLVRETLISEITAPGVASRRYEMHSLIQRHARGLVCQPEHEHAADVRRAQRSLAEAYLEFVVGRELVLSSRLRFGPLFDGVVRPAYAGVDAYSKAMADLGAERANLHRIVAMASEAGFVELVWQLAEALVTFLFHRGHYADAIAVHSYGLAAATEVHKSGDARPLLKMHAELGTAYFAVHRHAEAAEHFDQAAELASQLGADPAVLATLAKMFVWKGLVHRRLDEQDAAIAAMERSAALVSDPRFPERLRVREERLLDMNGAPILAAVGRIAEAIDAGERAVAHFERDADRANHAKSVANLGEVLAGAGGEHRPRAESLLRAALLLEEEIGIPDFEACTCELLGTLLNREGDTEEGQLLLVRAAKLYELLADRRGEALRARLDESG
ncbi:NB-ARC domain-containing protein [Amycolatopsis sp. H20-H5]|uniref:NB-ARC domain-containing protein n=1 Tax=Amycolatopsis sp. H20-H5 TaxID=3046309 RepID=UPI002DC063A3|nr:NB-ARC domain-containing protein [Amycolatopsis sp. H20-H5]MEC3975468.1 NB-ARC domain-containing protein [Amycolatopsis sp. H20-H5]